MTTNGHDPVGVAMNPDAEYGPEITITVQGGRPDIGTSTVATMIAQFMRDAGCEVALMSADPEQVALERLVRVQGDEGADFQQLQVQVRDEPYHDSLKDVLGQGLGSTLHLRD